MTGGIAPTPPAAGAAAATGIAASAMRRPPDEAGSPPVSEAETARRAPVRAPGTSPPPDPDGQRGRLIDVFA